jgi:hypothetical protein
LGAGQEPRRRRGEGERTEGADTRHGKSPLPIRGRAKLEEELVRILGNHLRIRSDNFDEEEEKIKEYYGDALTPYLS